MFNVLVYYAHMCVLYIDDEHSKKFIIIVMDGMSEFDWHILSKSFAGVHYQRTAAFAMIPTVTSVSRQCHALRGDVAAG